MKWETTIHFDWAGRQKYYMKIQIHLVENWTYKISIYNLFPFLGSWTHSRMLYMDTLDQVSEMDTWEFYQAWPPCPQPHGQEVSWCFKKLSLLHVFPCILFVYLLGLWFWLGFEMGTAPACENQECLWLECRMGASWKVGQERRQSHKSEGWYYFTKGSWFYSHLVLLCILASSVLFKW